MNAPTPVITREILSKLVKDNHYIKTRCIGKKPDTTSLAYIIERKLNQGQYIQMGHCIENVLRDLVVNYTNLKDERSNYSSLMSQRKNEKGSKEADHLFIDTHKKIIYYAELKANPNLDTEKTKATIIKCSETLKNSLRNIYPGFRIKWCLLICRYIDYSRFPPEIKKKFEEIKNNVFGINDYFQMLGIDYRFTEDDWISFVNEIANELHHNCVNNS